MLMVCIRYVGIRKDAVNFFAIDSQFTTDTLDAQFIQIISTSLYYNISSK